MGKPVLTQLLSGSLRQTIYLLKAVKKLLPLVKITLQLTNHSHCKKLKTSNMAIAICTSFFIDKYIAIYMANEGFNLKILRLP